MPDPKSTIEHRLTRIETLLEEHLTNDFPHLQRKVDKIFWLLFSNLIALIFILLKEIL